MTEINQKIFKEAYVEELRSKVDANRSYEDYNSEIFDYPTDQVWVTGVKVDEDKLSLKILDSGNQAEADLENSIKLYEAFHLDDTQASDARLWVFLSHSTFRKYVMARWKLNKNSSELGEDPEEPKSVKEFILSHWFVGGNDRSLRRHAISRLWWAAHLTASPWTKEPNFYQNAKFPTDDPYYFTRILFSTQDVFQQVLERSLGRDNHILIPVLAYIGESGPLTREQIRDLVKELNLALSIRNISMMNFNEIKEFIENTASEIFTKSRP